MAGLGRIRWCCFLLTATFCCAQDPWDRVLQLARVRQKMVDALTRTPDYTCLATTQRAARNSKSRNFKNIDTLRFEIAHAGSKELWAWPGAAQFQETPLTTMIQNDAISLGDFALYARSVFVDGNGRVKFAGPEQLAGHGALRWNYDTPQIFSKWQVSSGKRSAIAGASGSFWADPATLDVLRLEMRATDLPWDFPLTEVVETIDYARTRIGDTLAQLPQSVVLLLKHRNEAVSRNATEFSHCKQYSSQATISFDARPADGAVVEQPKIEEVSLPAALTCRIRLESTIESGKSLVGDLVSGTLEKDVIKNGVLVLPKGSLATGRLRRVEKHEEGPHFIVGIEFDEITYSGHHARFFGSLSGLQPEPAGFQWFLGSDRSETVARGGTSIVITKGIHLADVPGVGTFFMLGSNFRIPKGTILDWETRSK